MKNDQDSSKTSSRKQFYFLTLSHTVLDSYATLLSHLQPLLLTKLATAATRNSLAGNFVAIYSVFSSFGQILFGWLSDRLRTVHFLTIGVAFSALGLESIMARAIRLYCISAVGYWWYWGRSVPSASDDLCRRARFRAAGDGCLYFSDRWQHRTCPWSGGTLVHSVPFRHGISRLGDATGFSCGVAGAKSP